MHIVKYLQFVVFFAAHLCHMLICNIRTLSFHVHINDDTEGRRHIQLCEWRALECVQIVKYHRWR